MFVINFLYAFLILFLVIVLHDLGQAAAGKALGFKIYGVTFGRGRVPFKSSALGLRSSVRLTLLGGRAIWASPTDRSLRLRLWLTTFAGPAVQLILLGVVCAVVGWPGVKYGVSHFNLRQPTLLGLLIFVNAWFLIMSFVPSRWLARGGEATDGYRLMTIPFIGEEKFAAYRAQYTEMEARELLQSGRYPEAIELYEKALEINPQGIVPVLGLHQAYLYLRNYARARELLLGLRGRKEVAKGTLHYHILNNIAWTEVMLNNPRLLYDADDCSKEAFEEYPGNTNYRGTRGAVLVCIGQSEEGLKLLAEAYRRHKEKRARGSVAYWAAIAQVRRGDQVEAEKWLAAGILNSPDDDLRQRAEGEIIQPAAAQISA
jgi:hypothetical protein